jgi:hypothetical protein
MVALTRSVLHQAAQPAEDVKRDSRSDVLHRTSCAPSCAAPMDSKLGPLRERRSRDSLRGVDSDEPSTAGGAAQPSDAAQEHHTQSARLAQERSAAQQQYLMQTFTQASQMRQTEMQDMTTLDESEGQAIVNSVG